MKHKISKDVIRKGVIGKDVSKYSKYLRRLGIIIFIIALFCNPFLVEQLFSPDRHLDFLWKYFIIAVFELVLLIVAYFLYFKPTLSIRYYKEFILLMIKFFRYLKSNWLVRHYKELILLFVTIIITSIIGFMILAGALDAYNHKVINSYIYGWDVPSNFTRHYVQEDIDGTFRNVNYTTYDYGAKRFPSVNASGGKIHILVLGDSFTEATQVSNGEEYYAYLEKIPNVSVYAKGVGMWGTAQEYIFLKNHVKEIKPDIILIEFCYNDFINNNYYLSKNTVWQNPSSTMPFLENGFIVYKNPARIQIPLIKNTRLHKIIHYDYQLIAAYTVPFTSTLDYALQSDPEFIPAFYESVNTTRELFILIRNESPNAKIFSFNICKDVLDSKHYYDTITAEAGIEVIPGIAESVENASKSATVLAKDKHWDPRGHEIAGKIVSQKIQEYLDETQN